MTYSIKWREKALKGLRKLPRDISIRIVGHRKNIYKRNL